MITYNERGLVTSGRLLTSDDLPDFNADKITEGEITTQQLGDKSVTRPKLADYSTIYIQEAEPTIDGDDFIGVGWYMESSGQLRHNNSWMPVGFGRLSNDNLRWGGIVDAATGLVVGAGFGHQRRSGGWRSAPAATNTLGGLYLVISEAGDQITATPGVTYDAGDWVLCINEAEGWVRIDTMTAVAAAAVHPERSAGCHRHWCNRWPVPALAEQVMANVDLDLPTKTSDYQRRRRRQ